MELNREDGGRRQCILVTNNEITKLNPNGIAKDVTAKRLRRIMCGECYDGSKNFKWREKNAPYGDGLLVLELKGIANNSAEIFDKIDERDYGLKKLGVVEKTRWVCENFEITCKKCESDAEYEERKEKLKREEGELERGVPR